MVKPFSLSMQSRGEQITGRRLRDRLLHIVGDKTPLIIPPVTDKLTYFNNETVRRLWQEASNALLVATRVFVIGYSLPISDLGMEFFLRHSLPIKDDHLVHRRHFQESAATFIEDFCCHPRD